MLTHFDDVSEYLTDLVEENRVTIEVKNALSLQDKMDGTFLLTLLWWNNILEIMNASSYLLQA